MLQQHLLETQAGIRAPLCQVLPRPSERQSLSPAEIGTQACRALARLSQRRSLPLRVYKQTKGGGEMEGQSETPSRPETHPASPDSKASGLTDHMPHFLSQSFSSASLFATQQQAPCCLGRGVPGGLHRSWQLSSAAKLQDKRNLSLAAEPSVWSAAGSTSCFPAALGTHSDSGGRARGVHISAPLCCSPLSQASRQTSLGTLRRRLPIETPCASLLTL